MATRFEIVLHGDKPAALRAAGEEALGEIEQLEAQLSLFRASSEIACLNARAAKGPVRVTPPLFALLQQAHKLSAETGGAFFEVSKDHSLEWIYAQIEAALRNQYNIGYTPLRPRVAGQYRKIRLTTKRPGLVVQARDGYYSK